MNVTALLEKYSIIYILGLENETQENQTAFILKSTQLIIKRAIDKALDLKYITEAELKNIEENTPPQLLQEELVKKIPQLKEIITQQSAIFKKEALVAQTKDMLDLANSKIKDENIKSKTVEIINNFLKILEKNQLSEEDQKWFDRYYRVRELLTV